MLFSVVTVQIFEVVTSSQEFPKTTLRLCETALVVLPPTGKHFLRYDTMIFIYIKFTDKLLLSVCII